MNKIVLRAERCEGPASARGRRLRWIGSMLVAAALCPTLAAAEPARAGSIERGRYLVKLGGCNDCHTAGYAQSAGKLPEAQWLTGDTLGFHGPWGTTYPSNLRLYMQRLSAEQWVSAARGLQTRPPMPWFTLHDMTSADLRAMHAFIRSLGPAGVPAPAALPPGQEPGGPVVRYP